MGLQPPSKLDADIAQHIGYSKDRRTYLSLKFALFSVLVVYGVFYSGNS